MDKVEMLFEAACGTGVLLAPFWLIYKFALYILS